jgi:hypothetical protein
MTGDDCFVIDAGTDVNSWKDFNHIFNYGIDHQGSVKLATEQEEWARKRSNTAIDDV